MGERLDELARDYVTRQYHMEVIRALVAERDQIRAWHDIWKSIALAALGGGRIKGRR